MPTNANSLTCSYFHRHHSYTLENPRHFSRIRFFSEHSETIHDVIWCTTTTTTTRQQGLLSFWNDNISYTLRGCIVMELALRGRIAVIRDPNRRRFPLADRCVCLPPSRQTAVKSISRAVLLTVLLCPFPAHATLTPPSCPC